MLRTFPLFLWCSTIIIIVTDGESFMDKADVKKGLFIYCIHFQMQQSVNKASSRSLALHVRV